MVGFFFYLYYFWSFYLYYFWPYLVVLSMIELFFSFASRSFLYTYYNIYIRYPGIIRGFKYTLRSLYLPVSRGAKLNDKCFAL